MGKLTNMAPLIQVSDMAKSIAFYEEYLGFKTLYSDAGFAHLRRDSVSIKLQLVPDHVGELTCYIDVEDIDAVYAELKDKLETLPPGRFRAPFNQDYGMREFHVIDLDHLLIFFGEEIKDGQ